MVDMAREERLIRVRTSLALAVTLACFALARLALPRWHAFPEAMSDRFALAAQAGAGGRAFGMALTLLPGALLLLHAVATIAWRQPRSLWA